MSEATNDKYENNMVPPSSNQPNLVVYGLTQQSVFTTRTTWFPHLVVNLTL